MRERVDAGFESGGRCREERGAAVFMGAAVTNGLRVPPASPVSRRSHRPSQWACGQAVTLPR